MKAGSYSDDVDSALKFPGYIATSTTTNLLTLIDTYTCLVGLHSRASTT